MADREKLLFITKTYIQKRIKEDHGIICVYLTGSMKEENPFINNTSDIDLIFVHESSMTRERETIAITEDVSFDIFHYKKSYFSNSQRIRLDPYVGSSLCFDPVVLVNKMHWFDFTLASVEASFFSPENTIKRALFFLEKANKSFSDVDKYAQMNLEVSYTNSLLSVIESAINALSILQSKPTSLRRFIQNVNAIDDGENNIAESVYELLTGNNSLYPYKDYFIQMWKYYFEYYCEHGILVEDFNIKKANYFEKAVEEYWDDNLYSSLWIMLSTWTRVNKAANIEAEKNYLGFTNAAGVNIYNFVNRKAKIKELIDECENEIKSWAKNKGIMNIYDEI